MASLGGPTLRLTDASAVLGGNRRPAERCRLARGRSGVCDFTGAWPEVPSLSRPSARSARALPQVSVGRAVRNSMADEIAVIGGIDTQTDLHQVRASAHGPSESARVRAETTRVRTGPSRSGWVRARPPGSERVHTGPSGTTGLDRIRTAARHGPVVRAIVGGEAADGAARLTVPCRERRARGAEAGFSPRHPCAADRRGRGRRRGAPPGPGAPRAPRCRGPW